MAQSAAGTLQGVVRDASDGYGLLRPLAAKRSALPTDGVSVLCTLQRLDAQMNAERVNLGFRFGFVQLRRPLLRTTLEPANKQLRERLGCFGVTFDSRVHFRYAHRLAPERRLRLEAKPLSRMLKRAGCVASAPARRCASGSAHVGVRKWECASGNAQVGMRKRERGSGI
jgi:hypothetical protein